MFDDIPDNYKNQTADNPDEGWRYTQGDKNARRPPELLTRDHVARCINREVKAGRGSPHGGVFLDIAWIKEKLPNAVEHIKKKLPSHVPPVQEAGGPGHHHHPDGGRPHHPLRDGRRARRRRHARCRKVPGLFAAGECAAGINGANRLGGNSLSRPDRVRQAGRRIRGQIRQGGEAARRARQRAGRGGGEAGRWPPSIAPADASGPFQIQYELQEMMQDLVGIVRREEELRKALEAVKGLQERAEKVGVAGQPRVQPGLVTRRWTCTAC